jgi:RNAse (barnase) inhibitor barstar
MSSTPAIDLDGDAGPIRLALLTEDAVGAICAGARLAGFDCVRIDLAGCDDKAGFLARTAKALGFPAWFGQNWDALADCLTDLGWRPASGYVLVFEHASSLQKHEPEVFDTALAILSDVAVAWQARGATFRAFVSAQPTPGSADSLD